MWTRRILVLSVAALALSVSSVDVPLAGTFEAQKRCQFDRECNDGNPCTADKCSGNICANPPDDSHSQSCYSDTDGNPLAGRPGVGQCRAGTRKCSGGRFGACIGAIGATAETCGNGDENCDGRTDEADALNCTYFSKYKDCAEPGCSMCLCKAQHPYVVRKDAPDGNAALSSALDRLYQR